jgi:hypothetical protein
MVTIETAPNCPDCGRKVVCPRCAELATYQTPDKTFWDSNAHYWRCECFVIRPEVTDERQISGH